MALHSHALDWLDLALNDADLQSVIKAWKGLAEPIRRVIVALRGSILAGERDTERLGADLVLALLRAFHRQSVFR